MKSLTAQEMIVTYVLPYISRSRDNQAVKFGQLIKYCTTKLSHRK